jgi:8-oxo-dGTP pyrophosphatase MutT (NUDIX family)
MSSLSRSSSRPSTSATAVGAVGLAVFICAWAVLHQGWFARGQIIDTPVYQAYGWAIARGEVPYRDFSLEYPPGALPAFALPGIGTQGNDRRFRRHFETLMFLFGAAIVLATAFSLVALRAPPRRAYAAVAFVGIAPLLLGSVVLTRFDLWPAALAAVALALVLSGRLRLGHIALGAAIAAKVWPAVLAPLFVAYVWRSRGRREALLCAGLLVAAAVAVVLPFFVLAPGGVWDSVVRQTTRPLQLESLGAALIVVAHDVFGTGAHMVSSHGSQNLGGGFANAVGGLQTLLQVAVVVGTWTWFARAHRDRAELVRASAAVVVAFVALGKVVSPQFLIWLIPFVPLVRGRRGLRASGLLAVALVLTQAWFPQHYWSYALHFSTPVAFLVVARDVVLIALLVVLLVPQRRTWDDLPVSREKPYGATVVVRRGADVLLLHRAHEGPEYDGDWAWTPPSGARLPEESPEECARRELREEAGLDLELHRVPSAGDDWTLWVADAAVDAEVTLDAEHDAYRWLPPDEAAALCKPDRVAAGLLHAYAHGLDRAGTA